MAVDKKKTGAVEDVKAAHEDTASPRDEAFQALYDAAYRVRHNPGVIASQVVVNPAGTFYREAFTELLEALDKAGKFLKVSPPKISELSKSY